MYRVMTKCAADVLRLDVATPDAAYARLLYDETVKALCYTGETVRLYENGELLDTMTRTGIKAPEPWPEVEVFADLDR